MTPMSKQVTDTPHRCGNCEWLTIVDPNEGGECFEHYMRWRSLSDGEQCDAWMQRTKKKQ